MERCVKKLFNPNWYEDITKYIKIKIRAVKCYKRELRKSPHSRSIETLKALSIFRGSSSGVKMRGLSIGKKNLVIIIDDILFILNLLHKL